MKTQFVVFRLQAESYSHGLHAVKKFDTESEAVAYLEKQETASKSESHQVDRYVILPEYTV